MSIVADEALRFNPNEASLHYNYANGLGKDGNYVQSEEHYLKALKLQPDTAIYYSNLGTTPVICFIVSLAFMLRGI